MDKRKFPQTEEHKRKISISNKGKHFDRIGKKLSEETRAKMRIAFKGRNNRWGTNHSEETKRKMSESAKGRKATLETRKKISEFVKNSNQRGENHGSWKGGKPKCCDCGKILHRYQSTRCVGCSVIYRSQTYRGEKNSSWRGGKSFEPYTLEWTKTLRLAIRQRNNFTCQRCGITEEEHIQKFGRILSVNHIDYDKTNCDPKNLNTLCASCNTAVNFNREYWTNYFKQKLCLV